MGAARFILQLSISMVIAMIAIVLVYVHSTKDTSKTQESNVVTSVVTDSVPSYIDDIRSLSLGEVHSITTYLISGDDFATVVLTDGTECYCDQAIARDLRDAIDGANDKEFEIWTNNDNEHEIICIN
ncbi:hypothetical protein M1M52_gp81 [uncultured phage cr54_1]|uniref:Uncharacterized protein n=1 Tax=uncultured phage cr54_1 TaxID=2986398 RepID=A0AAE7RW96_9CAUD|nr:hypothetical protein M1M52_gp81 [uncultured phage cr54_1]QWM90017.1 hypothetical protein [uncultured phage cr54_1]